MQVTKAIYRARYTGGWTNTASALKAAKDKVLDTNKGMRPDAKKVVVVMTDGKANRRVTINKHSLLGCSLSSCIQYRLLYS